MRPQDKYDKEKMLQVKAKYKKEFVEEFKEACKTLNIAQSEVIRAAMNKTIEELRRKNMSKHENLKVVETTKYSAYYGEQTNDTHEVTVLLVNTKPERFMDFQGEEIQSVEEYHIFNAYGSSLVQKMNLFKIKTSADEFIVGILPIIAEIVDSESDNCDTYSFDSEQEAIEELSKITKYMDTDRFDLYIMQDSLTSEDMFEYENADSIYNQIGYKK